MSRYAPLFGFVLLSSVSYFALFLPPKSISGVQRVGRCKQFFSKWTLETNARKPSTCIAANTCPSCCALVAPFQQLIMHCDRGVPTCIPRTPSAAAMYKGERVKRWAAARAGRSSSRTQRSLAPRSRSPSAATWW